MKRKTKQPDGILSSDWHLQDKQPISRIDDFQKTQFRKVSFINKLQLKYDCPVLLAGDLFDYWKPSLELLAKTAANIPKDTFTILGNHDLPQHNLELMYKCGVYVLHEAGCLKILKGTHWGQETIERAFSVPFKGRNILIWHTMTFKGEKPWPDCTDPKASRLLRKYPEYDLILTGHNHIPFTEEYKGRLLVNPGSIFRTTADQINHKPRVYLWYADTNTVEPVYIPIEDDVVTRTHLQEKEQRESRISNFVNNLDMDYNSNLNFEKNLEMFFRKNKTEKNVKSIIYKSINK